MPKKLKPVFKWIAVYLSLVFVVDLIILLTFQGFNIPGLENIYERGAVIKIKPYAWAFVHGGWGYDNCTGYWRENKTKIEYLCRDYEHVTSYNYNYTDTLDFVEDLYDEGYTHIWGTWCYAGDEPFIESDRVQHYWYNVTYYPDTNATSRVFLYADISGGQNVTLWPEYVQKNKNPGITLPIFTGFSIILTSWEG